MTICHRLVKLVLLGPLLTSCMITGNVEVETDPKFDWNTLKRDEILLTPLLDVRRITDHQVSTAPIEFYNSKEAENIAEAFKQKFYKLRKDIRVFGAGGAFENIARIQNLAKIAATVFGKRALDQDDAQKIIAGSQDIRFVLFFALIDEQLIYNLVYNFREDQERDTLTYLSQRSFQIRMALWDSKENKTVWIGTERLTPTAEQRENIKNPTKMRIKVKANTREGYKYIWTGQHLQFSLEEELRYRHEKFPAFPTRDAPLYESFADFALAMPLDPSEEKLIEYSWLTYHRPQINLSFTPYAPMSQSPFTRLYLGSSSLLALKYRLSGQVFLGHSDRFVIYQGQNYRAAQLGLEGSIAVEKPIANKSSVLLGVNLGLETYAFTSTMETETTDSTPNSQRYQPVNTISDRVLYLQPEIKLLLGDRIGLQGIIGLGYRALSFLHQEILKQNPPPPWTINLGMAYTFRGF